MNQKDLYGTDKVRGVLLDQVSSGIYVLAYVSVVAE